MYGVNHKDFDLKTQQVISNASCTTNCFVPVVKVLDDAFGVENGLMQTVHAYTGDQQLVDGPHKDLRRARGAAINIVPTSTGAARATSLVLESMKGKLDGTSLRVPVPVGSIVDFTANLKTPATRRPDQRRVREGREGLAEGDPRATPRTRSCRATSSATRTARSSTPASPSAWASLVKVLAWYDNEWGYSNRLVDITVYAGGKSAAKRNKKK